jgi:hypothetical protein
MSSARLLGGWHTLNALKRIWVPHPLRFQSVRGLLFPSRVPRAGGPDINPDDEVGWPIRGVCVWGF